MGEPEREHMVVSDSALERVDRACDAFEAAWRAGGRPRIEDYLGPAPEPERVKLLEELLKVELEYRARAGECPAAEEYRLRLPADADVIDGVFATVPPAPGADGPGGAAPGCPSPSSRPQPAGHQGQGAGGGPAGDIPRVDGTGPYQSAPGDTAGLPVRAGRYLIEGEIARGGMGAVLRARDPDLHRPLAVKVLLEQHRGQANLARRFLVEAQVTGQLQHPGIPPVHEVGSLEEGRPFFAMKLIRGRTLAQLLQERPDPSEGLPRWLAVFEQVCQTLAYAHSQGVIHRDLKPSNIMVGAFGEVQVMDWGLAKVLGAARPDEMPPPPGDASSIRTGPTAAAEGLSGPWAVLGTLAYMAPEQARGEVDRLDERSDVFGLGAILCVILTGRPPYLGAAREVLSRAERGDLADAFARLDGCGADGELVRQARRQGEGPPAPAGPRLAAGRPGGVGRGRGHGAAAGPPGGTAGAPALAEGPRPRQPARPGRPGQTARGRARSLPPALG
jgi:hypothetical protein